MQHDHLRALGLASGKLHPRIDAVYPLAETARALAHVAERRAIGKVLVVT